MVQSPSWEANWFAASHEIPRIYGTRRFITAFTSFRHPSLFWASPIQSTWPQPTSWRSILILSTHLRLGLPSGLFPSGFPTRTLYAPLLPHTSHMPSPSHSSRFYHNVCRLVSQNCWMSGVVDCWPRMTMSMRFVGMVEQNCILCHHS